LLAVQIVLIAPYCEWLEGLKVGLAKSMNERNGTVLVVDDDPQALALLMNLLKEEGYQVQPADSGKLALLSVAAQAPDLILLDVKMPGMDGFEVCRRLKETDGGRQIPLMFVGDSSEKEQLVKGLSLGAVDFVPKPFQREELLARVTTHVELGRLRAKLEIPAAQRSAEARKKIEQLQLEVAERRRAEEALRESEQRFRQIANAAPAIIWTSDADHRVDFRNEYAQAFTGRSMEKLIGEHWAELIHPEDLERLRQAYPQGLLSRRNFQLEYRLRRADGEYCWMLEKGTPSFLPNGEFAGCVGIVFDLTDVRRAQERALREKNLENLRVLSAGIAHDFNTMVGTIFGEVDLALSDMPEGSPGRENFLRIDTVAKRAAEIVRLLLAYVGDRADADRSELVNLNAVVREIVPYLKVPILKKAQIGTSLAPKLPSVRANMLQIRLVALNLIINAIEALEGEKGMVTVTTAAVEIRRDSEDGNWRDLPDGSYVKLEVRDTGRGMAEEVQDRIFDPYYSTKFLGRGLGLAAVQGIIRTHRGAINARSTPGEGSTFEVLLPIAEYTPAETESWEAQPSRIR
jgi:PAS domain S-box-containing protein